MKKLVLAVMAVMAVVVFASVAIGATDDRGVSESMGAQEAKYTPQNVMAEVVALPFRLLSIPYFGMWNAAEGAAKIKNETGRTAVQFTMAPLWIPAAILHLPQAGLSLIAPSMFTGFVSAY